jgi:hypothetical protein
MPSARARRPNLTSRRRTQSIPRRTLLCP